MGRWLRRGLRGRRRKTLEAALGTIHRDGSHAMGAGHSRRATAPRVRGGAVGVAACVDRAEAARKHLEQIGGSSQCDEGDRRCATIVVSKDDDGSLDLRDGDMILVFDAPAVL